MPSPQVQIQGARELRAALKRAGVDLVDLKAANAAVSAFIASRAANRAPRRTGHLAGTLRGNKAAGRAQVLAGRAAVPYAGPIHWGWASRGITAQPWIAETAKDTEHQWLTQYQNAIDDIIRQVERSHP